MMEVQKQTSGKDFQRLETPSIFLEKCGNPNRKSKNEALFIPNQCTTCPTVRSRAAEDD